ncbi:MFS transporter [Cryptosporangium phraense]|uniref:MFS transporter n=1 Tax=Cryptosporangium phraense TaxID=2593070 RepID=A0A545AFJ4_9ACTN|nr:MFS transporter [Cryptosporangium phraense]TQS40116.1 MFS transporter [Cryptosporangium phraense]
MLTRAAYLAAVVFGAFWGTWGSAVPRVRAQSHLDDGQLGVALLFVSAGALPAMLLAGRALDRWGLRCAAWLVATLGAAGVATAVFAEGLVSLCVGLVLVGVTSGANDVAMNSVGGRAERVSGRPVITRAGGVFSASVVVSSLGAGAAYAAGASTWVPFAGVLGLAGVAAVAMYRALPSAGARPSAADSEVAPGLRGGGSRGGGSLGGRAGAGVGALVVVGVLGALAFASENAHQSWGAIYLVDVFGAGAGLSALAPAVFAGVVAVTRFGVGALKPGHARVVLVVGAIVAAAGAAVVSRAPTVGVALAGLVLAAAGTAGLFPTFLSIVSGNVAESARGRATSIVTVVSYLGFLLGPVYVGAWAGAAGLRGAMLAVAALGVALAALTLPLLAVSRYTVEGEPGERHDRAVDNR